MTQAVPTSLPNAVGTITAFAETVEHTTDSSGGKYVVNGEEGGSYNIENTDNSSLHAEGNDITIEVNGDTREVYFDGNKQDITVNGNTQSIQDTQSANKDGNLHVTGDVVKSGNGNANSIYQGHGSTVTVEGSANASAIGLTNGSSLSTGYNTDGTSSGKSGDITVSGGINATWASNIKADGDISANNINIEGNPSNDDGSNVEATGDVTTHNLALHHHSELVAHGVEVTKDPNDSHSGNIKVYTGSTIRTTQDGIKAETLDVDSGTVDSQKIDVNGNTYVWNQSSVSAEEGLTVKNGKLSIKNESIVNVGDESQNKSADLTAQRQIIVGDSTASNDNSSVNVNGNISANAGSSANSLEVNSSSVKASGNITGGDGRLSMNKGASVEAGGNIEFERQLEVNDSSLKAGGDIQGTNIILSNSSVEADNIKAVANQAVDALGYVSMSGAVNIKGNLSANGSVATKQTAHELDETSNARSSIDGNVTGKGVSLRDTDVNGDIVGTNGNVTIDNVEQTGDINAENTATVRGNSTVTGDVNSNSGAVYVNSGSTVNGNVHSNARADVNSATVSGDVVSTNGNANIHSATTGRIESHGYATDAEGNITYGAMVNSSEVHGGVDSKYSVLISKDTGDDKPGSTIDGDVNVSDGGITIQGNGHIKGNATGSGTVKASTSIIDGTTTGKSIDAYNSSVLHDVVGGSGGVKLSNGAKADNVQSKGTVELYGLNSKEQATQKAQVEAQSIDSDSDVTINHGVVHGDVQSGGNVDAKGNSTVEGNVSGQKVNIEDSDIGGAVTGTDDTTMTNSTVGGNIEGKSVQLTGVTQDTTADTEVASKNGASIHDSSVGAITNSELGVVDVDNSTTKDITNSSTKANDPEALSTTVINNSTVNGNVETQGGAEIHGNTHITGNVETSKAPEIESKTNLEIDGGDIGTVRVDGNINVDHDYAGINHAEIGGTINSGAVSVENSTVHKGITANGSAWIDNSSTKEIVNGSDKYTGVANSTVVSDGVAIDSGYVSVDNSNITGDINAVHSTIGNANVEITDSTVDGNITAPHLVTEVSNSTVNNLDGKAVKIKDNSTIHGDINTTKSTTVNDSQVDGTIQAGTSAELTHATTGNVYAEGITATDSTVKGDIGAESSITLIGSQVEGDTVSYTASISDSTVKGSVSAEGTIYIEKNSHIDGNVASTAGKAIIYDSTVKASVSAEKDIEVRQDSIDGDVTSKNGKAIITDSSIGGNISVKGENIDAKGITEIRHSTVTGKTATNNKIEVYSSNTGDLEGKYVFTQKDETAGNRNSTGNITSTVGVSNVKDTDVHGNITSEDKVEVTDSTVSGDVDAKKNATIKNSTVSGDVHGNITSSKSSTSETTIDNSTVKSVSGDRVNIKNNSTIQEDVNSKYGATVNSSNIKGELKSDKYAKVTNSTVDGETTVGTTLTSNETIFNDDVEAETVKADGKLLVKGDFKADIVQFNAGSKVDVLGNYTADRLDADNNEVYVKGDSNTKSIIARDGNSAKVDGTATVGNQNTLLNTVTSDNGTVEVGELVIKQNTGNTDTNIHATNGGTITVNGDLDTTEAIASASKSGKGIKLEADGGNSVIHIKGDVSDTNKDNKSVGMNVVATNNGTIQIDGDAEGKYNADGGTVNISGTAKTKELNASNGGNIHVAGNVDNKYNDYIKADNSVVNVDDTITGLARIIVGNDGTVSAKNGISAQTAQVTNKSTLKSEGDIKINDTLGVNNGSVTTDKKFVGSYTSVFKDGTIDAKEGIETRTLSVGNIGGSTVSTLGSIVADNIRSAYSTGELGERNKVIANDTIKGAINTKSTMGLGYVGTDFESNKIEITGKSDMEDTNVKANELTVTAKDGVQPDIKMSGGVLDISGDIKIEGVLYNNDSVAKMSLNDTDIKIGGTVASTVEGHSSQLEVNGGEHNNSLVLNKGTDNVSVKTDKASADIKGDVTVANENESGAVQVKEGNLKLTDGNLVYTTSNNEEVKVNHGDIELSSKDAIQLIETGHDVVLLENYNVNSTGNGIAGSFEKLAIDDKSSINAKGTGIRSLAETAEITAQTDVIGDEYGVESGSQLKYTTADSVIGGKAAFLKDDFTKQDDITVWEAKGEKVIDSKNGTATAEQIEKAEKEIKYVIKQSETENGTIEIIPTIGTVSLTGSDGVEKTYNVALQDQIVRVKIIPDTGYQVKSTSGRTAELKSVGDNIYELKVPRGGGVNISALMEAIVDDTKNNNNAGVDDNNTNNNNSGVSDNDTDNKNNNNEPIPMPSIPQTPVLSGNYYGDSGSDSYEYGPAHETYDDQHMWTTTMHGTFKESPQGKKFIGLDGVEVTGCVQIAEGDGKYNWYLFDSDGLMQTGWHTLRDGKWYYFYADGHMAKDEVTPDGCYVDYTGAWEEVEHVELAE